jgi:photosystem II stability/assembly factor-like uncharacterized protein
MKHLATSAILFIGLFCCPFATAQWVQTSFSTAPIVYDFEVADANLFAGTNSGIVYLSTNDGATWTPANGGFPRVPVYSLVRSETNLFAGTSGGIFLSTNNGATWTPANGGLPQVAVISLAVGSTNLLAGTFDNGVYLSTNSGSGWARADTGKTHNLTNCEPIALVFSGTDLFAGLSNWGGVRRSTDNGATWTLASSGLTQPWIQALIAKDGSLFAGTAHSGVFRSTNNGLLWTEMNAGLMNRDVSSLAAAGPNLFAGAYFYTTTSNGGVSVSTDAGTSWTHVGLENMSVYSLAVSGTYLLAGTDNGVWRRPITEMTVTVDITENEWPREFFLQQNYPNPFNPSTTIKYGLPRPLVVTLSVYDILGRQVSVLVNERKDQGIHEATFDASGLSTGMYLYRLQAGEFTQMKRLQLVR